MILLFNPLTNEVLDGIVDKFINQLRERLKDKHIELQLTNKAKQSIIDNGSDITFGARPLKRYIQQNIETVLAYKIIEDNIERDAVLEIDYLDDKYVVNKKI